MVFKASLRVIPVTPPEDIFYPILSSVNCECISTYEAKTLIWPPSTSTFINSQLFSLLPRITVTRYEKCKIMCRLYLLEVEGMKKY